GKLAGAALNVSTPVSVLEHLLDTLDLILVMTINPGFGGQEFQPAIVNKVAQARALVADRPIHIEVDGGIDSFTAPLAARAGANVLVAGSAVFRGGSVAAPDAYGANIRAIREAAEA
ncbi:MAG: ribulose-phosphate 3-epimerase, partial [Pseudomonadota bacterium]